MSTSTAKVTKNTAWNLAGQALPITAAIFAMPALIETLGQARFGVLTLIWVVVGYSSLFDLGIGRALTALVAEAFGADRTKEIPPLVWTSLTVMFFLGLAGGGLIALASPWFVRQLGQVPPGLLPEMTRALWVLAAAVPVVICSAGLAGVLEAAHRFDLINAVRAPLGVASYVVPLVVALVDPNVMAIAVALMTIRLVTALAYLAFCLRVIPELREGFVFRTRVLPRVLGLGGWMTISNLVSPLMVQMDRFFIGAMISAAAVGYYATSQEVVMRMTFFPVALASALFPSFASNAARGENLNTHLFGKALNYMFLAAFPIAFLLSGLAEDGLSLWLGSEFAASAALPLQILACGLFAKSLARVALAYLQASARPDLAAKAHLVEFPAYVVVLVLLATHFGIVGVAIAWTLRVSADATILFFLTRRVAPEFGSAIARLARSAVPAYAAFGLLFLPFPPALRWFTVAAVLGLFCYLSWTVLMTPDEHVALRRLASGWRRTPAALPETTQGDL